MILTNDLNPTGDYTRILNEAIFDERLSHAEFRIWCQLLALPKGQKSVTIVPEDVAKQLGITAPTFRHHRSQLKEKGYLASRRGELVVTFPGEDFKPKEPKLTKEQQQRAELRDVWNDNKPGTYSKQKHPLSAAQVETLQAHAQHNGEHHLGKFLKAVLTGCKADSWWSTHGMNFGNLFGTGSPKQKKFGNVEKLYRLSSTKAGQAAVWDVNDDQSWLDWYQKKGIEMERVIRLDMERFDAWEHETEHEGDKTLYVYTDERGIVVHWTYKEQYSYRVMYLPTDK